VETSAKKSRTAPVARPDTSVESPSKKSPIRSLSEQEKLKAKIWRSSQLEQNKVDARAQASLHVENPRGYSELRPLMADLQQFFEVDGGNTHLPFNCKLICLQMAFTASRLLKCACKNSPWPIKSRCRAAGIPRRRTTSCGARVCVGHCYSNNSIGNNTTTRRGLTTRNSCGPSRATNLANSSSTSAPTMRDAWHS
jgi:hypothetical protein